nr:immunoglobulin heavy chain junction region [Mus musculus]
TVQETYSNITMLWTT